MQIEILDSIECEVPRADAATIAPCLSFKSTYWVQGPHKKSRKEYMKQVFSFKGKKVCRFYTGLLPRVLKYCEKNNISVNLIGEEFKLERQSEPNLKGPGFKKLRDYQLRLIDTACEKQRGILVAPTGCLTGDTIININRAKKGGKVTLDLLYKKWNGLNSYGKQWDKDIKTHVRSYDGGKIKLNEVKNVVYSGVKEVYELELSDGKKIKATYDHKIMTKRGWVELGKLQKSDDVMLDVPRPKHAKQKQKKKWYSLYCNLWFHPFAPITKTKKEKRGYSKRVERHRIVFEANLNNIDVEKFIYHLKHNKDAANMFKFVDPSKFYIHHIDGNEQNNNLDNLLKVTPKEHIRLHNQYANFSQGIPEYAKVKSIKSHGKEKTYDICCKDPHNNFVANGIVVHNSGKTVLFLGLISCYPEANFLILCHTTTIIAQTIGELKKFGFKNIQQFGGGNKIQKLTGRIVASTIQSFSKLKPDEYIDYFDAVIVDEAHSVAKQGSQYSKVLSNLLAPIRIGVTATPLKDPEAQLTYEGLLGPILDELTLQEASELNVLADPKLKLVKAEFPSSLSEIWNYQDSYEKVRENGKLVNGERTKIGAYSAGITENKLRNLQIARLAQEFSEKNQTVLVFVTHIEHGERIQKEAEKLTKMKVPFVQGNTPQKEREQIKKALIDKKIKICIATISWMEGLNIPSLNCLILAGSGKSEKQLLQKIGRVLRRTKDKDQAIIIDFLDLGSRHLILHTGERLSVYSSLNWL